MNEFYYNNIKDNPLYIMSLASNELFHSNFWDWLLRRDKKYIKVFFSDEITSDYEVKREEGNRDITIKTKDKNNKDIVYVYVIENKFKSLPKKDQLQKYETALGSKFKCGKVTGIIEPEFIKDVDGWNFLGYTEICEEIKKVDSELLSPFEKQLVKNYADTFLKFSKDLTDFIKRTDEQWVLDFDIFKDVGMDDIAKKLKTEKFCEYLNKKFSRIKAGDYHFRAEAGFSHKRHRVDARLEYDKGNPVEIGIQVEHDEYRWFVKIEPRITTKDGVNEVFKEYEKKGWFVDYNPKSKTIREHITGLTKVFRTYEDKTNDSYIFIFQYWKIKEISFDELAIQIEKDLELASDIITNT